MRIPVTCVLAMWAMTSVNATERRVPADYPSIAAANQAASAGDVVLVSAGRYRERVALREGVTLRSEGDDTQGMLGLVRAERTIIDGGGQALDQPGVRMAQASCLDGFTITGMGAYDDELWQKHYETRGKELNDDDGSLQPGVTVAAIQASGVSCEIRNNLVHHNGDVGIALSGTVPDDGRPSAIGNLAYRNLGGGIGVAEGSRADVSHNRCFENLRAGIGCRNASPVIAENICYGNVRAGIGCREGARPLIRGNECYQNRRAGIGIRMPGTAPIVDENECYENGMAGIGCRDQAEPVIRDNHCLRNQMAGIGCDGAFPLIVGNTCRDNEMAGIGVQGQGEATIKKNLCIDNRLVAIGITQQSRATIIGNTLERTGGVPPLLAVKDDSQAIVEQNRISGGGVAGLLVQGRVTARDNQFVGKNEGQGNAVWIWEGSQALIVANQFDGYRSAVNADKASVTVAENLVRNFEQVAIVIKNSVVPAHVYGNQAITDHDQAQVLVIEGKAGIVADNLTNPPAPAAGIRQ